MSVEQAGNFIILVLTHRSFEDCIQSFNGNVSFFFSKARPNAHFHSTGWAITVALQVKYIGAAGVTWYQPGNLSYSVSTAWGAKLGLDVTLKEVFHLYHRFWSEIADLKSASKIITSGISNFTMSPLDYIPVRFYLQNEAPVGIFFESWINPFHLVAVVAAIWLV